jgi:hypothetical protein
LLIIFEAIPVWTPVSTQLELLDPNREVYITANVSTTEPELAARVPVTVYAVGSIGTASAGGSTLANVSVLKNIATVCLSFSGAHTVLNGQVIVYPTPQPNDGAVCLGITNIKPKEHLSATFGPGEYLGAGSQTIEWLDPTDSTPSIVIWYWTPALVNGVLRRTNTYSDPTQKLTIEPSSTLESTKRDIKLLATEVAFFSFTLIQVFIQLVIYVNGKREKTPLNVSRRRRYTRQRTRRLSANKHPTKTKNSRLR